MHFSRNLDYVSLSLSILLGLGVLTSSSLWAEYLPQRSEAKTEAPTKPEGKILEINASASKAETVDSQLLCEKHILERMSEKDFSYLAKSNSIVAKAERRLEPQYWPSDTGQPISGWKLSTSSRWMFISINEQSEFTWPDWHLKKYEMKRKGLSKSKNFRLDRKTNGDLMLFKHKSPPQPIQVPSPAFDPLNYQLRLQLDLACKPHSEPLSYSLVKKDAIKIYQFKIMGAETVETEAGKFDGLLVEKIEEREGRKTQIWFAKNYDYTLLKLEHLEKERVTVLELKEKPDYW